MNALSLVVAASLLAAPSFAAREPAPSAASPSVAALDGATREALRKFYQLVRSIALAAPGAKASLPPVESMADLTETACADYAKACAKMDVELQFHRGDFAAEPATYDFARSAAEMGLNSTVMLCATAGRMERSKDAPYSARRACAEERAKAEPFSDAVVADVQGSKNLDERSKKLFAALHAAIAAQARANCDAAGY